MSQRGNHKENWKVSWIERKWENNRSKFINVAKTVLRGKCIALNAYIRKVTGKLVIERKPEETESQHAKTKDEAVTRPRANDTLPMSPLRVPLHQLKVTDHPMLPESFYWLWNLTLLTPAAATHTRMFLILCSYFLVSPTPSS